jgi:serine/threonine-protein kinase
MSSNTDASGIEDACPVRAGDVVGGKYRVERVIGAGGMGVVVAAMQVDLQRAVAVKFLLPHVLARPDFTARFSREARAAARLESQHVARVLDVGQLDDGAPYLVMEYLSGTDLAARVRARGPLPRAEAVHHLLEASEAVAEAHQRGIVHRDLKPSNLFLAERTNGTAILKVLDFGISKLSDPSEEHDTSESSVMGSPQYMSPEHLLSMRNADARSDIWSLGVVLHELLTGKTPFRAQQMPELVATILQRPASANDLEQAGVPEGLQAVVLRCLEKEPAQRFADVGELAAALAPFGPRGSAGSVERIRHTLRAGRDAGSPVAPSAPPRVGGAGRWAIGVLVVLGAVVAVRAGGAPHGDGTMTQQAGPAAAPVTPGPTALPPRDEVQVAVTTVTTAVATSTAGVRSAPGPRTPGSASPHREPRASAPDSVERTPADAGGIDPPQAPTDAMPPAGDPLSRLRPL